MRKPQQTMELEVKCLWRTQLHDSKVTGLTASEENQRLYSACAETVTKPANKKAQQGGEEAGVPNATEAAERPPGLHHAATAVKATDWSTGKHVLALTVPASGQPLCTTISSMRLEDASLTCVAGDCSLWRWQLSGAPTPVPLTPQPAEILCNPAAVPLHDKQCQLPMLSPVTVVKPAAGGNLVAHAGEHRTAAAGVPKAGHEAESCKTTTGTVGGREAATPTATKSSLEVPDSSSTAEFYKVLSALKAENFVKATGYRGTREGFTYRNGPWGRGYYSKDIIRDGLVHTVPPNEDYCGTGQLQAGADRISSLKGGLPETINSLAAEKEGGNGHDDGALLGKAEDCPSQQPQSEEVLLGLPAERRERQAVIGQMLAAQPVLRCSVLSADGSILYTGSWGSKDTKARSWDTRGGGQLMATFEGHTANVLSLALSPDQSTLYSGSYDSTICGWVAASGERVQQLRGHRSGVHSLCVSPDGLQLFSCGADNTVRLWDLQHGCCLRTMQGRHEDMTWPVCMCLTPDGELLATGSNGLLGQSTVKIFHVARSSHRDSGKCLATLTHFTNSNTGSRSISALAFSPRGDMLFSGGSDGSVAAWKLQRSLREKGKSAFKTGFLS